MRVTKMRTIRRHTAHLWIQFFILGPLVSTATYSGCDIATYYQSLVGTPEDWSRSDLHDLLGTTHRNILPYTSSSGGDDAWKALIDLDSGSAPDTVKLIYSGIDVPANPHGTSSTWNREHLWPKSRGVEYEGADFTDVHHLRPADANVNSARNNKHFSECGIAEAMSECTTPAHPEAAVDTSADPTTFSPPASVRGDIARALFYMDVRYSGGNDELDLVLTDCLDPNESNQLGYLSQLLKWHEQDPVDDAERTRNLQACQAWQGNRNPFVDFPNLASQIFGTPSPDPSWGNGYPCGLPDGTCSGLGGGDVMIVTVNSDNPDVVALVALSDLPEGTDLYMTDNAWTGSSFQTNEGTVKLTIPTGGISAGTVFGYGDASLLHGNDWIGAGGTFSLAASGDTILLYCLGANNIVHLGGLSLSNGWAQSGLDPSSYGTSTSALPAGLSSIGAVALPHKDNVIYNGPQSGTKGAIQTSISTEGSWNGSDSQRYNPITTSFTVTIPTTSAMDCNGVGPGDIMIILMNSDNPDTVAFVALSDISEGTELYMTDNAWTGSKFRSGEGTKKLTIPNGGISTGTIFGYGDANLDYSDNWVGAGGTFSLSASGDTVLLYCFSDANDYVHLAALSFTGDWEIPGLPDSDYGTSKSALPASLSDVGAVTIGHVDNCRYDGRTFGSKTVLQQAILDPDYWSKSNSLRFSLSSSASSFLVECILSGSFCTKSADCCSSFCSGTQECLPE